MTRGRSSPDDQARELAATLVRMAQSDRPPHAAYHRALGAMAKAGALGGILAGSSASAGMAVSSKSWFSALPALAKWGTAGVIGGAIAVSAPKVVARLPILHVHQAAPTTASPSERPSHGGGHAPVDIGPPPASPIAAASTATQDEHAPEHETPPRAIPSPSAAPARPRHVAPDALLGEVAELDKVRSLLLARAPDPALAALDKYAERYPSGSLRLEANVLRIEALAKSGRTASALALAKQFLAAHGHTPLAYRVRDIVESLGSSKE